MKKLYLLLFFLNCGFLFAQSTINGKVKDNTGKAVKFAFVAIINNDSTQKVIAAKVADTSGFYELVIKNKGSYIIRATAVGYKEAKNNIQVVDNAITANLVMQPITENLKDVSVTSKKPLVERKIDRIVMNVENNALTTGKSSMEAIGLAPGVFVRDGQISINGNTSTNVMINGKLLKLSGEALSNYLNSLRSEDIKSIEIMAHPPAEYDAEGTGGLINIILKRRKQSGFNGSIYGNYSQGRYAGTTDGVQLNYQKGKIGAFANYSFNNEKAFNDLNQIRNFSNEGKYSAANRAITTDNNHRIHTGITYDINDKQYVAIDYTGSFSHDQEIWNALSTLEYPNAATNNKYIKGTFPNKYKTIYNDIGLNYHLKTDGKGSAFTFLSDYTNNKNDAKNNVFSSIFNSNNQLISDTSYRNQTPSKAKIFTADAKYTQVLNTKTTLSFGAKLSASSINNIASFEYFQNDSWKESSNQNFTYDYKENVVAGYINYSGNIFNTDVQIGLRGENTNLTGTLYDTAGVTKNPDNYFGLFPSVYLRHLLNENGASSLSFVYNRRLSRPSFNNLNPHVSYIDNYTTGRGNPFLTPEYNNSFELSYTFFRNFSISASYSYVKDVINNTVRPVAENTDQMMQQPLNSGSKKIWMLTAFAPVKITNWWTAQNTLQLSNQEAKAETFDLQKNIALAQTSQQIQFTKDFSMNVSAYYMSNLIFANAIVEPLFNANVGIQKKLMNGRLTLKASADNILRREKVKGNFYYNDFKLNFNQVQQKQKFTIGFNYNFNLGKSFKTHKIESSNQDEKNRLN